jgi:hypothetical protein
LKKTAAILLLGILLFNWCGYRIVAAYFENRADLRLEAQLDDNNYDALQLISIKVPLTHLPYWSNSVQFLRVDGEIEIEGIQYKYCKSRLFNDSLELLCIPNQSAMNMQMAKNDIFKLINDLQHNGQKEKSSSHSGNSKVFSLDNYMLHDAFGMGDRALVSSSRPFDHPVQFSSCYVLDADQPPEIIS